MPGDYLKPLQIGSLRLESNLIFAPLCGCSNLPTRLLARENGAALVFSEMVKSEAVVRKNRGTQSLLYFEEAERPLGIQICGGDEGIMAETARTVTQLGPNVIDINLGCPVKKIVATHAGCALLKDPAKAGRVVNAVVRNTHLPVTVKMRCGWDESCLTHPLLVKAIEEAGASMVTVHGRTRSQFYDGPANWAWIGEAKASASRIPVIGNGDVRTPQDALRMFRETGCDGIMIGRAALGNPWIFNEIRHFLATGELPPRPSIQEILRALMWHFDAMIRVEGAHEGIQMMRRHASWYIKGAPGAARLRNALNTMNTPDDFHRIYREFAIHGAATPDAEPVAPAVS